MMDKVFSGKTALVTGASSGLGIDFARELARQGADLLLTARRQDTLEQVAQTIIAKSGVKVRVIPADLSQEDGPDGLYRQVRAAGLQVDVLVNNAGFGLFGDFLQVPWEQERQLLQVDVVALTRLTRLFVADMVERRSGYVLQVSSIGAYQPSPTYAMYSAAKTYVLNFSEALNFELRGTGVSVTTISPGVTATHFFETAGQKITAFQRASMMQSQDVARIGIDALAKRRSAVVPGFFNGLMTWASYHLAPRSLASYVSYRMMKE